MQRLVRNGFETAVPVEDIKSGDFILVKRGEGILFDGIVIDGFTCMDESMLSGVCVPVEKQPGERVYAGSVNQGCLCKYQVQSLSDGRQKAPCCQEELRVGYADAKKWHIWYPFRRKRITKAMEAGIIIKKLATLHILRKVEVIMIDKTGTLTEGKMQIIDVHAVSQISKDRVLQIAASIAAVSSFLLSEEIVSASDRLQLEYLEVTDVRVWQGYGVEAEVEGRQVLLGNEKLMKEHKVIDKETMETARAYGRDGLVSMMLAVEGEMAGILCAAEIIRPNVKEMIEVWKNKGIRVELLTGDEERAANFVAEQTGIEFVYARLSGADKAERVRQVKVQGQKTVVIGDGWNDLQALTEADIGVSIDRGNQVVNEAADIVCRDDNLQMLTILFGRNERKIKKEN